MYSIPLSENRNPIQYIYTIEKSIINGANDIKKEHILNQNKLLKKLNKINQDYVKSKLDELKNNNEYSTNDIMNYYTIEEDIIKMSIEKAVKSLVSKYLIYWNKMYYRNKNFDITLNDYGIESELNKYKFLDKINEHIINDETGLIGIYGITNLITNKIYIGSSIDINRRLKQHIDMLKTESHHNYHLQNEYNLYGLENYKFEILERVNDIKQLPNMEYYHIEQKGGLRWGSLVYNISNPLEETEVIQKRLNYN